jgi:hypothetical protein
MANAYGRIAAVNRTDATETELYDVPAATQIIGRIYVCNRSAAIGSYSIAVTDGAGAATAEDWIIDTMEIPANFSVFHPVELSASNYVRVKGVAAGNISFMLMGCSIT